MKEFAQDPLVVLQIHVVRCLSRGQMMKPIKTMQPQPVSGSPIGQAYIDFDNECEYYILV